MNRLTFIKSLFGLTVGTLAKPWELPDVPKPIEIYTGFIAGYQYYSGEKMEHLFSLDDELKLVREPFNHYDSNAIAVYFKEHKIGFIPMEDNKILTNMIDQKMPLISRIKSVSLQQPTWERVGISISSWNFVPPSWNFVKYFLHEVPRRSHEEA